MGFGNVCKEAVGDAVEFVREEGLANIFADGFRDFVDLFQDDGKDGNGRLSEFELNWGVCKFVEDYAQDYFECIQGIAKWIEEYGDGADLSVKVSDKPGFYPAFWAMAPSLGDGWTAYQINPNQPDYAAYIYCTRQFDGKRGFEAVKPAAMMMTYVLVQAFDKCGFYTDVYEDDDGSWAMELSWEEDEVIWEARGD